MRDVIFTNEFANTFDQLTPRCLHHMNTEALCKPEVRRQVLPFIRLQFGLFDQAPDLRKPEAPRQINAGTKSGRQTKYNADLADAILTAVYDNRLPSDECSIVGCQK
jgi:hypothetical protein